METITFKGVEYKKAPDSVYNTCSFYGICDKTQIGEFFSYREGTLVFHTTNGFLACYKEDLNNCWAI